MTDLVFRPVVNRPFSGLHQIAGITTEVDVAGSYQVRIYDRLTGRLARECWSATNGAFTVTGLANRLYIAVAMDHNEPLRNAAIVDFITPEPR
jgi:hypothetical protein